MILHYQTIVLSTNLPREIMRRVMNTKSTTCNCLQYMLFIEEINSYMEIMLIQRFYFQMSTQTYYQKSL